jgi:hypothetical protein
MSKNDLVLENIAEVKKLIELGKANNEVTYDEIMKYCQISCLI